MSFSGVAIGTNVMRAVYSMAPAVVSGLSTIANPWIFAIAVAIVAFLVVVILISIVHF